jgi:hypothetical protein
VRIGLFSVSSFSASRYVALFTVGKPTNYPPENRWKKHQKTPQLQPYKLNANPDVRTNANLPNNRVPWWVWTKIGWPLCRAPESEYDAQPDGDPGK